MATTRIPCPKCNGAGHVRLPAHLVETLALLNASALTAHAIAAQLDIKPTAANNRLAMLRQLGLATSSRSGKTLYWYPVAKGKA